MTEQNNGRLATGRSESEASSAVTSNASFTSGSDGSFASMQRGGRLPSFTITPQQLPSGGELAAGADPRIRTFGSREEVRDPRPIDPSEELVHRGQPPAQNTSSNSRARVVPPVLCGGMKNSSSTTIPFVDAHDEVASQSPPSSSNASAVLPGRIIVIGKIGTVQPNSATYTSISTIAPLSGAGTAAATLSATSSASSRRQSYSLNTPSLTPGNRGHGHLDKGSNPEPLSQPRSSSNLRREIKAEEPPTATSEIGRSGTPPRDEPAATATAAAAAAAAPAKPTMPSYRPRSASHSATMISPTHSFHHSSDRAVISPATAATASAAPGKPVTAEPNHADFPSAQRRQSTPLDGGPQNLSPRLAARRTHREVVEPAATHAGQISTISTTTTLITGAPNAGAVRTYGSGGLTANPYADATGKGIISHQSLMAAGLESVAESSTVDIRSSASPPANAPVPTAATSPPNQLAVVPASPNTPSPPGLDSPIDGNRSPSTQPLTTGLPDGHGEDDADQETTTWKTMARTQARGTLRWFYFTIWTPVRDQLLPKVTRVLSDPNALLWHLLDAATRLIDLFYLLVTPVIIAFSCDIPRGFSWALLGADIFTLLSVMLSVVRPRYDEYGQLVSETRAKMRMFYRSQTCWLKVVACIPIDWVFFYAQTRAGGDVFGRCGNPIVVNFLSNGEVGLASSHVPDELLVVGTENRFLYNSGEIPTMLLTFSLLRLIRFLGTVDTLMFFKSTKLPFMRRAFSRLAKNLLLAIYVSHWNASVFWFISSRLSDEHRFINQRLLDSNNVPTSFVARFIMNYVDGQKALFFLLREVELVGEAGYQAGEMLIAAVIYGSIFGNLVSIVRSLDDQAAFDKAVKSRNFKKAFLRQYLINNKFPATLQRRILDQEEFDFIHKKGMDTDSLFSSLPKTLRQEIFTHLYWELVSKVPLFSKADDTFKLALTERITAITVQAGFYICKAGDAGQEMYFIRSGGVHVMPGDESKVFVTLQAGSFFGEIALMEDSKRTATCKTASETQLCVLHKNDFLDIMKAFPTVAELIYKHVKDTKEADAKRKLLEEAERQRKENEEAERKARSQADARSRHFLHSVRGLPSSGGSRRDMSPLPLSSARKILSNRSMMSSFRSIAESLTRGGGSNGHNTSGAIPHVPSPPPPVHPYGLGGAASPSGSTTPTSGPMTSRRKNGSTDGPLVQKSAFDNGHEAIPRSGPPAPPSVSHQPASPAPHLQSMHRVRNSPILENDTGEDGK